MSRRDEQREREAKKARTVSRASLDAALDKLAATRDAFRIRRRAKRAAKPDKPLSYNPGQD